MRDSYCYSASQLTWVALARKMPASCSPTRSFLGPPVAALGPHLAPLLAPSLPARRSGLATLCPGKVPRFLTLHQPADVRAKKCRVGFLV